MKIPTAFDNVASWLASLQNSDGSWSSREIKHKEPYHYQKSLILTMQCIRSLVLAGSPKTASAIKRAMRFCLSHNLEETDLPDTWAWKLQTLLLSNLPNNKDEITDCLNLLKTKQVNGSWGQHSTTPVLTNYSVVTSLFNHEKAEKLIEEARKWFHNSRAKDNNGWGIDSQAAKSEFTFTANAILAIVLAGEDPAKFKSARKFLETGQGRDGSWTSSKLTLKKPTTYATAISALALMMLSENPDNKRVQLSINWLESAANPDGGWPLVKGEQSELYTTYFVLYTLSFYNHISEMWDNPATKQLKKVLTPQQITAHLFREFESSSKERFKSMLYMDLLTSKALGTTTKAVARRQDILKILAESVELEPAEIIDKLKELPGYDMLNKKAHMTQIKSDLEFLRDLHLVDTSDNKYYVVLDALNY